MSTIAKVRRAGPPREMPRKTSECRYQGAACVHGNSWGFQCSQAANHSAPATGHHRPVARATGPRPAPQTPYANPHSTPKAAPTTQPTTGDIPVNRSTLSASQRNPTA